MRFGEALFHHGLEFCFCTGVAGQEAAAGEAGDCVGDKLLFVEAVSQALLGLPGV